MAKGLTGGSKTAPQVKTKEIQLDDSAGTGPARLATEPSQATVRLMLPREHGAWGMLLLPFVTALVLSRRATWEVLPAAVLAAGVFVAREPLVVLWRQARVWKQWRPETEQARRSLAFYLAAIALSALILLWRRPIWPLVAMGVAAAALTAVSAYLTVQNRQRSLGLQLASAAGLTG